MAEPTLESIEEKVAMLDRFVTAKLTTEGMRPHPGDFVALRDAIQEIAAYLRERDGE